MIAQLEVLFQEAQAELGKITAFRDWMLELVEQEETERLSRRL